MNLNNLKTNHVNGRDYKIELMTADDAWDVQMELLSLLGPVLGKQLDEADNDEYLDENSGWSEMITALSKSMRDTDTKQIINKVLKNLTVNGMSMSWKEAFIGKMTDLMKVVVWAIKENFPDFFYRRRYFRYPFAGDVGSGDWTGSVIKHIEKNSSLQDKDFFFFSLVNDKNCPIKDLHKLKYECSLQEVLDYKEYCDIQNDLERARYEDSKPKQQGSN